jgi:hypothetical protein
MDSSLSAMMLADAQALASEIGQTITVNSVSYQACVSEAVLTQSFESGGLMDKISTMVKIPATSAALAQKAYMAIGKTLTWDSNTYRITGYNQKPGSAWIQLTVQDSNNF